MKTKVVIGGSTVTAGQLKDLFRMIGDGTIGYLEMCKFLEMEPEPEPSISVSVKQLDNLTQNMKDGMIGFEEMKEFLENPQRGILPRKTTHVRAANILGAERIVFLQEAHRFWKVYYDAEEHDRLSGYVRYTERTLREAASQNKSNKAAWFLVYVIGLTLPEQVKKIGTDTESQPNFHLDWKDKDWFLDEKEKFWADKKPTKGDYYLINFKGYETNGLQYFSQLGKIGEDHGNEIIDPHVLSESIISLIKSNKMANHYKDYSYRSSTVNSKNEHVCIGYFLTHHKRGLNVTSEEWNRKSSQLRIIVYKKHEF